jgi:hypothetical protein
LETAEKYADGRVGRSTLGKVRAGALIARDSPSLPSRIAHLRKVMLWNAANAAVGASETAYVRTGDVHPALRASSGTLNAIRWDAHTKAKAKKQTTGYVGLLEEEKYQCGILRDIFGNPFRPLPPRPKAIAPLAEQIYAGAWDKIPLLGEWLQEHGYWSEGEHCLDPNNHHVKGCWVVDWVTGRE